MPLGILHTLLAGLVNLWVLLIGTIFGVAVGFLTAPPTRRKPPGEIEEVKLNGTPITVSFDSQGAVCPVCRSLVGVAEDPDVLVNHVLERHPYTKLAQDLQEMRAERDRNEENPGA